MNRHVVPLALAGAIIVGLGNATLAQAPQPPEPSQPAQAGVQSSAPATSPNPRDQIRAEKKAKRMAARGDCRAQAKQQSLAGDALRSFMKSCVAAH